jgi:thioredoxin
MAKKKGVLMSKVVEITDQSFEAEVLESDVPCEVDFWAPWCTPCRMVAPVYDRLSEEHENFKFCKMNVDENQRIAMEYGIKSIPMQMFFVNGKNVDEILGAVPEKNIRDKVEEVIQKFPTDEKGRLKVILSSCATHNRQDSEKFAKWLEKADEMRESAVYNSVRQAVERMAALGKELSQLVSEL